jgi:hypothetical protein
MELDTNSLRVTLPAKYQDPSLPYSLLVIQGSSTTEKATGLPMKGSPLDLLVLLGSLTSRLLSVGCTFCLPLGNFDGLSMVPFGGLPVIIIIKLVS